MIISALMLSLDHLACSLYIYLFAFYNHIALLANDWWWLVYRHISLLADLFVASQWLTIFVKRVSIVLFITRDTLHFFVRDSNLHLAHKLLYIQLRPSYGGSIKWWYTLHYGIHCWKLLSSYVVSLKIRHDSRDSGNQRSGC